MRNGRAQQQNLAPLTREWSLELEPGAVGTTIEHSFDGLGATPAVHDFLEPWSVVGRRTRHCRAIPRASPNKRLAGAVLLIDRVIWSPHSAGLLRAFRGEKRHH